MNIFGKLQKLFHIACPRQKNNAEEGQREGQERERERAVKGAQSRLKRRANIAVYAKLAELSVLACPPVNQAHNELIEIIAPTA